MIPIIIIIDNHYFDVTEYANKHPGGANIIKKFHLKDATIAFNNIRGHSDSYVDFILDKCCIGPVNNIDIDDYLKRFYST